MTGARIINRRTALLNAGVSDALDIQREGFQRSEELRRTTGVSGKQIARESADHEFQIWWEYRGFEESSLPKSEAKREWLKGFRGRGWGSHRNPPSLGTTARDIYQGWKQLAEGPQPPRAVIEGFVPGLGRFDFRNGKIVRLFKETGRRGTVSTYEPASKADIEGIHDAIDKGQFQVEQRTISGAGGVRKFEGAGALEKVFHQATGRPLPEFLETAEGAAWWERMSR